VVNVYDGVGRAGRAEMVMNMYDGVSAGQAGLGLVGSGAGSNDNKHQTTICQLESDQ
jgi:hypothetical protein